MALRLEEQCSILHNCSATLALVEPELRSTFTTHAPEKLRALKKVIPVAELSRSPASQSVKFPAPDDNEPAFILYTSGSTGEPKGAVHRQADIFYTNQTYCHEVLRLKSDDRLFSSSRLPFAYGLGNSFTFPLLNGATSILCREKPSPDVIARMFAECRPTIFFGVPVVYNLLLDYHRHKEPLDCSSLRLCVSAGEALPANLGEEWEKTFGVQLLDGIGSTEMLHMFMSNHENEVRYGSSGKLLEGYQARLVDENGKATPDDVEGNLWIKGDSAALGYWEKPEQSARTFVDGWVRTGDLYRRDSEGFWFHMGRSDDCFKSSGQWVSPVEVEGVLLRHPRVARVAVVEDFDAGGLPCPCAFVVAQELESDPSRLEQDLRESVAASLPRFKQPRRYVFVSELPYTATGKIQRFKLRQSLRSK
jgi:benzoate-CoA ligase family protein